MIHILFLHFLLQELVDLIQLPERTQRPPQHSAAAVAAIADAEPQPQQSAAAVAAIDDVEPQPQLSAAEVAEINDTIDDSAAEDMHDY